MDLGLKGKVAFITGGSKGIGRACAMELAGDGARVAICARREEGLRKAAQGIRDATAADVFAVGGDMIKWEDAQRCVDAAAKHFGGLDILVNAVNAGPVATERWDGRVRAYARDKGMSFEEASEQAIRSIPLGRICTPEEVASVVTFVASKRASFMNGAWITLDGGQRKAVMDI